MKLTEHFINRVLYDTKELLTSLPHISGYRLTLQGGYGSGARQRAYEALNELVLRGELVIVGSTRQGGHEGRRFALPGTVKSVTQSAAPADPVRPLVKTFKPLHRDPFSNWRLCERSPFNPADIPALIR